MTHTLRSLERRLVLERVQIALQLIVDDFLDIWEQALERGCAPPSSLEFTRAMIDAGIYLLSAPAGIEYIEACHRSRSTPGRERLLKVLLP